MRGRSNPNQRDRALVVDDDPAVVGLVLMKLEGCGIPADGAFSAEEALQFALHHRYRVIVADVHMPRMNGIEMLAAFRETNPFVQVVMLTGDATTEVITESLAHGAADFVVKDTGLSSLTTAVTAAFERAMRWDQLLAVNAEPAPAAPASA